MTQRFWLMPLASAFQGFQAKNRRRKSIVIVLSVYCILVLEEQLIIVNESQKIIYGS